MDWRNKFKPLTGKIKEVVKLNHTSNKSDWSAGMWDKYKDYTFHIVDSERGSNGIGLADSMEKKHIGLWI